MLAKDSQELSGVAFITPEIVPSTTGQISVVGIGLDGAVGLNAAALGCLQSAVAIAGSPAQLQLLAEQDLPARHIVLGKDLAAWIDAIRAASMDGPVTVLASGDPLFYGIGRMLLEHFDREAIAFHPHISCVQLAFARLGIPWQDATIVSVHGRAPDTLETAIRQGKSPIAALTDRDWSPVAIAQAVRELKPPVDYRLWVCSALGSAAEKITEIDLQATEDDRFSEPNVVILQTQKRPVNTQNLPLFGIPDTEFCTFSDRPGLLTKQEVRMLSLGLLQLQPGATVWDIGAGTGSIAVEIARLVPDGSVCAIERTAAGLALIRENANRFGISNLKAIAGSAPEALNNLPDPHRIVLGGGGAKITEILNTCAAKLRPGGVLVAHFATLEACATARSLLVGLGWSVQLLQVNLARSSSLPTRTGVPATRFVPLNPVTLLQAVEPNGKVQ